MRKTDIGDLIDENIALKRKIRQIQMNHLKSQINLFQLIFPQNSGFNAVRGIRIDRMIEEWQTELNKYLDNEQ